MLDFSEKLSDLALKVQSLEKGQNGTQLLLNCKRGFSSWKTQVQGKLSDLEHKLMHIEGKIASMDRRVDKKATAMQHFSQDQFTELIEVACRWVNNYEQKLEDTIESLNMRERNERQDQVDHDRKYQQLIREQQLKIQRKLLSLSKQSEKYHTVCENRCEQLQKQFNALQSELNSALILREQVIQRTNIIVSNRISNVKEQSLQRMRTEEQVLQVKGNKMSRLIEHVIEIL